MNKGRTKYVQVILPLPLEGTFTYSVPDTFADKVKTGMRVVVPVGKSKTYTAIIDETSEENTTGLDESRIKDIYSLPDETPMLMPQQMKLWHWMADYYMAALGDIYTAAMPAGLKDEDGYRPKTETYVALAEAYRNETAMHVALNMTAKSNKQRTVLGTFLDLSHWAETEGDNIPDDIKEITREELRNVSRCSTTDIAALVKKGILLTYEKEVGRLSTTGSFAPENAKKLNEAQQDAYNNILMGFLKKNVVLLHGVTSSGKTEIYIHLMLKALSQHQQVLFLLPEIALTVQMMERLQRVFGNRLGIYHSRYSDAERVEIWEKQMSQCPYDIIVGARSAALLPFSNLGLVIIDEEHETSFKQQDPAPRYHARSAAIVLASYYGAKTLLGTATPSMESYYNAHSGKYGLVTLSHRFKDVALPDIDVVDIKDLRRRKMMNGPFSPRLMAAMRESLANGQQVILFQNRRGYAPVLSCSMCGWTPKCKNCDVSLTYHKRLNLLTCHYCGFTMPVPEACPCCGNPHLSDRGFGTEKLEDLVRNDFPEARVARMDLDTTRTRNAYERIINEFGSGRTNVLIGTQMISKGLDFGNVAVVGILDADSMLNSPDFRAYEHAFMMMSQVAGRAGRRGRQGLVILQTREPELPVIGQVVHNDYQSFFQDLLDERRLFHYPPFYHLIYVYLRHKQENIAEMAAQEMGAQLSHALGERVLGPDKPSVARVKTLFIRKIVVKLEQGANLRRTRDLLYHVRDYLMGQPVYKSLQIYFDVDP